jgi:hypothetical protein
VSLAKRKSAEREMKGPAAAETFSGVGPLFYGNTKRLLRSSGS